MKLAVLAYLPPKAWGCSATFAKNLEKFPTKYDLLTYSESEDWPSAIRLRGNPEVVKGARMIPSPRSAHGSQNPFAVNNLVFFTGLNVAIKNGYTHAIYLESDCRVGRAHWDEVLFDEFFTIGRPLVCGGTLAVYNPCNYSPKATRRWEALVARNYRRNVPVATYGWLPASQKHPSMVFPNGAFSVLDLAWMARLYDLSDTMKLAVNSQPWDFETGLRIWEKFEEDAFEVCGFMNSIYSGYADILTTPDERKDMITSGKVVGAHQIKDNWMP